MSCTNQVQKQQTLENPLSTPLVISGASPSLAVSNCGGEFRPFKKRGFDGEGPGGALTVGQVTVHVKNLVSILKIS